jgi:hypothetical protein
VNLVLFPRMVYIMWLREVALIVVRLLFVWQKRGRQGERRELRRR